MTDQPPSLNTPSDGRRLALLIIWAASFTFMGLAAQAAYSKAVHSGANSAYSIGAAFGTAFTMLAFGALIAALFSIGRRFRTKTSWAVIIMAAAAYGYFATLLSHNVGK